MYFCYESQYHRRINLHRKSWGSSWKERACFSFTFKIGEHLSEAGCVDQRPRARVENTPSELGSGEDALLCTGAAARNTGRDLGTTPFRLSGPGWSPHVSEPPAESQQHQCRGHLPPSTRPRTGRASCVHPGSARASRMRSRPGCWKLGLNLLYRVTT